LSSFPAPYQSTTALSGSDVQLRPTGREMI
jgi:hypothetical protein